jgi:hypothetical protein
MPDDVVPKLRFQIVLTVNNRAFESVILSVFVELFTSDLNIRNPVYSILIICHKKLNISTIKSVISHPANQSIFS